MASLLTCRVFLLMTFLLTLVSARGEGNGLKLKRQKREWFVAPRVLRENQDYTTYDYIAKIRSDKENFTKIVYSLTGPGVNEPPFNIFGVDVNNGYVKVFVKNLDREAIPVYKLKGIAQFTNGSRAEKDLDLIIKIEDENDCTPVITAEQVGSVSEASKTGTVVMKVSATDADEENTLSSRISYKIESQSNINGMFYINPKTGEVMVQRNTLDREKQDTYKLTILACDVDGQPGGNTGTGTIEIKILDINDNIPTLEKESYVGSVEENTINMEVLRIKAIDMDLIYTENWQAVYTIVSGNEGGHFSIVTDSKTNEGIIMINKALDYEEVKMLNLAVKVSNKAEYNFGSGTVIDTSKSYPVKINVLNQREGPRFQPNVKVVTVSEDHTSIFINKVIATYTAIDSDTLKIATNVRYAKIYDEDNWLTIDENTAEIKLNKLPDRESKFLINGTYYAKIVCITNDAPSKTATGTIAIQVEDYNDHCPELTSTTRSMCLEDNAIYVSAVDKDEFPNAEPFEFTVIQGSSKENWKIEPFNETTVILRDHTRLWPGMYKVAFEIKDMQGKSCAKVQTVDVTVCTCLQNTKTCLQRRGSSAVFGASGILLLLLGLLLLLLVPLLLLFCLCGNVPGDFKPIPFDAKQQLIAYHTEGQGEDKEVPLLQVPVIIDNNTLNTKDINSFGGKGYLGGLVESGGEADGGLGFGGAINTSTVITENMNMYNQYGHYGQEEMDFLDGGRMVGQEVNYSRYGGGAFSGMALPDHFLGEYFLAKSNNASQQWQDNNQLRVFDYEGQGSLAGSVGCCSLLDNDNDLSFLNDLGPKFKTLAEICHGSTLESESVVGGVSISPVRPVSSAIPSTSTHTHVHTHSETIRDRDRINTLNTSNVASGSSTFIQEERITERSQGSAAASNVQVQDKIIIPNQTLLIQQPAMYYAAAPMYVVESKPQMVLVTGGTQQAVGQLSQVGQVGLSHGLVQVGGLQSSQGMVLVEGQVGMSGVATGQTAQGLSIGSGSRSTKVLVVENGSSGGEQGFVQTGQKSTESDLDMRGQGVQVTSFSHSSYGSTGSKEESRLIAPSLQGSQRVVMQQKEVSMTERSFESNTRA